MKALVKAESPSQIKDLFNSIHPDMQYSFKQLFNMLDMNKIVRIDIVIHDVEERNNGEIEQFPLHDPVEVDSL